MLFFDDEPPNVQKVCLPALSTQSLLLQKCKSYAAFQAPAAHNAIAGKTCAASCCRTCR